MNKQHANAVSQSIEWTLGLVSGALVLGVLVWLLVEGLAPSADTPILSITAGQPQPVGADFYVPFTVRNDSEATAASVVVEASLSPSTPSEQRSEVTLDYAPAMSEVKGSFVFTQDPRSAPLQLRVLGYRDP